MAHRSESERSIGAFTPVTLRWFFALTATVAAFFAITASAAPAAGLVPVWNLDMHHDETNFVPGHIAWMTFDIRNVGQAATSGPVTLHVDLPPGITRSSALSERGSTSTDFSWECPGVAGASSFTCTTSESFDAGEDGRNLILKVNVAANAEPNLLATATVSGGGAPDAPATAACPPGVGACASESIRVSSEPAPFGIVPGSWIGDFFESDAVTPVRQAGSHPGLATFSFDLNSIEYGFEQGGTDPLKSPVGSLRDAVVDLPPGFIGNPSAVGVCSPAELAGDTCPPSSQVGRADTIAVGGFGGTPQYDISGNIYNMEHPKGSVTDLGFTLHKKVVHVLVSLDPSKNYAIHTVASNINETTRPFNTRITIWGIPAESNHDLERAPPGTAASIPVKPFLTVPFQCEVDDQTTLSGVDSWQQSGLFAPPAVYDMPGRLTGCDKPRFEPKATVEPTSKQANSPTGLDVRIHVPQNENPNGLSTPPVKTTSVTLPQGMSFSPSFADGLQSCSLAQMKLGTDAPVACPDASRIGEVTLKTPLLTQPVEGSMYLAAQGDNPFHSLFALYLVLHDTEERGVLIKIPGKIEVDQTTGQITTSFEETPQFPFEDLILKFRSGPQAPLVNPPSCGPQAIGVQISSWSRPNDPVDLSGSYRVTEGAGGTACPSDAAHLPFGPLLEAGTLNPAAAAYSPFVFRLFRQDYEQELSGVTTTLPPGLLAKIAGIATCSDAELASISTAEGAGTSELLRPACPASSQIGSLSAGLGAGSSPNYFPGKVYLAGPYKGAPLSLAIVAPGLAGPFDLGNVVVRVAVFVDPTTAQVTAVSDPFPTILHGVLLRVKDVRLRVDRPETMLNPTNCSRFAVGASISSTLGALFSTSTPFQAGSCASLGFKPSLALSLKGGTKRSAHPQLKATLTYPRSGRYANIAKASVALPHSEFLEQGHIKTVCTRVQFRAGACPAGSVYGRARAMTPLFSSALEGPVYLRSSDHKLPDLVAVLKGPASQPVEIDLDGRIDSVHGGIRTTFEVVPDAPVSSFTLELEGGKRGLLVNSQNLCGSVNRATAKFTAQNGKELTLQPQMQAACKKGAHRHKGGGKGKSRPGRFRLSGLSWLVALASRTF